MESLVSERALRLLIRLAGIEYYASEHGDTVTMQNGNQDGKWFVFCFFSKILRTAAILKCSLSNYHILLISREIKEEISTCRRL